MLATVVSLRMHHITGDERKQMPKWMQKFFLQILPPFFRLKKMSLVEKPFLTKVMAESYFRPRNSLTKEADAKLNPMQRVINRIDEVLFELRGQGLDLKKKIELIENRTLGLQMFTGELKKYRGSTSISGNMLLLFLTGWFLNSKKKIFEKMFSEF